jgi:DNA-directed RNA polymerase II subunit RPB2
MSTSIKMSSSMNMEVTNDGKKKRVLKEKTIRKKKDTNISLDLISELKTHIPDTMEEDCLKFIPEIMNSAEIKQEKKTLLGHLGNYEEEPYEILGSYFQDKELNRLTRHQTESMNHFINYQMQATIYMFNPRIVCSEKDFNAETGEYALTLVYNIKNLKFYPSQLYENNGSTKLMMPQEARLRNFTYASKTTVDLHIEIRVRNEKNELQISEMVIPNIKFIDLPIMLKSSNCIIHQYSQDFKAITGECPKDCGGYFVIKGSEKTVLGQERAAENRIYIFAGKNTPKWDWVAEFKSVPDSKCISPKQIEMLVSSKTNLYGHSIFIVIPRLKQKSYIELFVLFRALGVLSDKEICEYILLNVTDGKQAQMLKYLEASIDDANKYVKNPLTIQEDAIKHIMTMVAFNIHQQAPVVNPVAVSKSGKSNIDDYKSLFRHTVLADILRYNTSFPESKFVSFYKYVLQIIQNRNKNIKKHNSKKREYTMDILNNELFPHCKSLAQKKYLLGLMANRLIQTALGWFDPDDRDSYINKRIELTGSLLNNLFRNLYSRFIKDFEKHIIREINTGSWNDPTKIINSTNIHKIFNPTSIENGINRALSTGDFSVKQSNSSNKVGVAQVLNRLTYAAILSHIRRINTPLEKSGELIAPRKLHGTTYGFLCPVETPEGQSIGVVKNISIMTHITIPTQSQYLYEYVNPYILTVEDAKSPTELYDKVKVFINGTWVGISHDPMTLYENLKQKKYKGIINIYTSIVFDFVRLEIRICNDGGRLTRPVLRVRNNSVLITKDIIQQLNQRTLSWNDLLTDCVLSESVIEYIDVEEQNYSMIGMKSKGKYLHDLNANPEIIRTIQYTHCEIHPSTCLGVLASCIPFPHLNQAPRNTYQCAMAKQAIGISSLNYDKRMDKTAYTLNYPSRPLIDTRVMDFLKLNQVPSGCQVHVAIMSYTGYNQEDSILINKGSIDRGLFLATIYHTEKDDDKNIIRDEIIRCPPDVKDTKCMKFGNYGKLNAHGFIPENTLVENRDILIAKKVPIKENRNDPTKHIKFEDQSKIIRTTEETYVDMNYTGRNGEGCNFAKTRLRTLRKPMIGDKFASRSAQKGTVGNIIPECDMPFTKNGLRPDIILNPHAIPSRMTIAQLAETLLGKVLIELGMFGDGTSFGELDIYTIINELKRCGYESYGNELLYDGHTGEQLEMNIFIGPVYYQRLKHMVNDKEHSRAIGPMVNLTRQPAEGRSRDGGFRIGEMERDVMIAHGMSKFCRERMYNVSDKYAVHVCKKCGMIATFNNGDLGEMRAKPHMTIHVCNMCKNKTDFSYVEIPYAYKLLMQELQTINVVPRIITE